MIFFAKQFYCTLLFPRGTDYTFTLVHDKDVCPSCFVHCTYLYIAKVLSYKRCVLIFAMRSYIFYPRAGVLPNFLLSLSFRISRYRVVVITRSNKSILKPIRLITRTTSHGISNTISHMTLSTKNAYLTKTLFL